MADDQELILNNPPLLEVRYEVSFPNNLFIAENRSLFYDLVAKEFPIVVIPEQSQMKYDFSDYALYTEDQKYRLEIGMSYFRLVSKTYLGFKQFRSMFLSSLGIFAKTYSLKAFANFGMTYINSLPINASQHTMFKDIFKIEVRLPEKLNSELFAGKGLLVVQKPEGYVTLEFAPEAGEAGVGSYALTLYFVSSPNVGIGSDQEAVAQVVDAAHGYLDAFFWGILTDPYLQYLRSR